VLNFFSNLPVEPALPSKPSLPILLIIAALLAGCGHKGPLYLPSQKPAAAKPATVQPAPADAATSQP
jgi:predicted small lipoprotein YifL